MEQSHDTVASSSPPEVERCDAFISYSHGASAEIAKGLQYGLQRFAKPWWRRRSLNVSRDETDLSANPALWDAITAKLDASDWLILIASPEAAQSKWVKREIRHWLGDRDVLQKSSEELDSPIEKPNAARVARLIFVATSGTISWHDGEADFDWRKTNALPKSLARAFAKEPLWIDLCEFAGARADKMSVDRQDPRLIAAVARIYACIKNVDIAWLIGEDAREHRRTMRTAWSTAAALGTLAIVAMAAAWLTFLAAAAADKQRQIAEADRQVASAQNLAGRAPARLPEAATIASKAYTSMRSLAATRTAPDWLISLLETGVGGWGMFYQIAEANRYRATFDRVQPAADVMRTAEQLLPLLVSRPQKFGSSRQLAFQDGVLVALQNSGYSVRRWKVGEEGEGSSLWLDPTALRVNGWPNAAVSADGRIVASEAASDRIVRIREVASGKVIKTIDPRRVFDPSASVSRRPVHKQAQVRRPPAVGAQNNEPLLAGVMLDGSGKQILLIARDGRARLLPTSKGAAKHASYLIESPDLRDIPRLSVMAMDRAGETIALTSSLIFAGHAPVVVLRASNGTAPFPTLMHSSSVAAIAFSPDGERLAVGIEDGGVFVYDAKTGVRKLTLNVGAAAESLAFGTGQSEHLLLVGTDIGFARAYDLATGREVVRAPHTGRIDAVAWNDEGRLFATAALVPGDSNIDPLQVWSVDRLTSVNSSRIRTDQSITNIVVSGDRIAATGDSLFVWDKGNGRTIRKFFRASRFPFSLYGAGSHAAAVAMEEDGLATIFDIDGDTQRQIPGPGLPPVRIVGRALYLADAAFDNQGKWLARVVRGAPFESSLCQIEIWSLADATLFDKLDCHDFASGIALSHQTQQLAWVESGNAPRVIARNLAQRSTSWLAKLPFDLSDNVGRKIAFSADDKLLAVGGKRSVMVFDALNGTQKLYVADVGADVVNLSINGDGTRLAVASGDGAIRVLDGESGTLLQLIPSAGLGGVAFIEGTPWLVAAFGGDNINNPRISQWYVDLDKLAKEVAERIAHLRPVVK